MPLLFFAYFLFQENANAAQPSLILFYVVGSILAIFLIFLVLKFLGKILDKLVGKLFDSGE